MGSLAPLEDSPNNRMRLAPVESGWVVPPDLSTLLMSSGTSAGRKVYAAISRRLSQWIVRRFLIENLELPGSARSRFDFA